MTADRPATGPEPRPSTPIEAWERALVRATGEDAAPRTEAPTLDQLWESFAAEVDAIGWRQAVAFWRNPIERTAQGAAAPPLEVEAWAAGYVAGREDDRWRDTDELAERAVDAVCAIHMDAGTTPLAAQGAEAPPTPAEVQHEGGPLCIDCDRPFQHRRSSGSDAPLRAKATATTGEDAAPRTEAGRYMLRYLLDEAGGHYALDIRAIEAEAGAMGWQDGMSRGFMEGEAEAAQGAAAPPTCKRCGHYEGCSTQCCMNQSEPCIRAAQGAAAPPHDSTGFSIPLPSIAGRVSRAELRQTVYDALPADAGDELYALADRIVARLSGAPTDSTEER